MNSDTMIYAVGHSDSIFIHIGRFDASVHSSTIYERKSVLAEFQFLTKMRLYNVFA